MDPLLIIIIVLLAINLVAVLALLLKKNTSSNDIKRESRETREMLSDELSKSRREQLENFQTLSKGVFDRWGQRALEEQKRDESSSLRISNLAKDNETRMVRLEEQVSKRLDEMRKTVDTQLNETLQKRVAASFEQVTKQLTQLYSSLAKVDTDMASLQKVFTGVKTRGVWGEVMLISLLEQILTPHQFVKNAKINPRKQYFVEVAIKMPGQDEKEEVLLPIDSKFPTEDYERLLIAKEKGDISEIQNIQRALIARIKKQAQDIRDKYIDPPYSTNFAVMYLPSEGLFAEVLSVPSLMEELQTQYKVTVCGPTTLAALLSSLKMGFTTLAIQKRSSEVWKLLSAVKKSISSHQENLTRAYNSLTASVNHLDRAKSNIGTINNKLRSVEEIPQGEADELIPGITEEDESDI